MHILLLRTFLVYGAVIGAMRLMGKRQISEMQPAELVSTFLLSNIASICIEDSAQPISASFGPLVLIACTEVLSSAASLRFPFWRRLLSGKPVIVIRQGVVDQNALRTLRISLLDLLEAMRGQNVLSPQEVWLGMVETDGSLSLIKQSGQALPLLPLAVDGSIFRDNMALLGLDESWLRAQLNHEGVVPAQVLAVLSNGQTTEIIKKQSHPAG